MDFIPLAYSNSWWLFAVCLLVSFVTGVAGFLFGDEPEPKFRRWRWPLWFVTAVALAIIVWDTASFISARDSRAEAFRDEVKETYGLTLTGEEYSSLRLPEEKPQTDFQVFGSVEHDFPTADGFEREEVHLIWRTDHFELASSADGEKFSTLDARG